MAATLAQAAVGVKAAVSLPRSGFTGRTVAVRSLPVSQTRRSFVVRAAEDKTSLFFPTAESLAGLDNNAPGFKGYDPLGLVGDGGEKGFISKEWLTHAEIINARWAMLGVAGMFAPEFLAKTGLIPELIPGFEWFKSGVFPPVGNSYTYWADPYALFFIELVLVGFVETKRIKEFHEPGSQGKQFFLGLEQFFTGTGNPSYPGGPIFNPLGLGTGSEAAEKDVRNKELENGRLAMLAFLAYIVQALATGKGPYQNLIDHVSNPTGANILTTLGSSTPPY